MGGLVRIEVLGGVAVRRGHVLRRLPGRQPHLVLAYLALAEGRAVPVDELASVVWPDGLGAHWEGALRGIVSKVRALLDDVGVPGPGVLSARGCYQLDPAADLTTDVADAHLAVAEAERLLADARLGPAVEAAARAVTVLDQPLLAGSDGPWLDVARADLSRLHRRALRTASRSASALGRHDDARTWAAQAVDLAHDDEESCRTLMSACLASGDQPGALAAYRVCREALAEGLGVSPSPETASLHLVVLAADLPTTGPTGPDRPEAPIRAATTQLGTPFVGRATALRALQDRWGVAASGQRQLVLVHGEPGVGKTRLVLESVRALRPVNVLFGRAGTDHPVPLQPFREALGRHLDSLDDAALAHAVGSFGPEIANLLPDLAGRIGAEPRPADEGEDRHRTFEAVRQVLGAVATERTVLVLDDLQWADPSSQLLLRHLLRRIGRARLLVLATWRDEADPELIAAETMVELHRIDGVQTIRLDGLDEAEITELLRASSIGRPTAPTDRLAHELLQRTGGNCFYLTQLLDALREADREPGGAADPDRGSGPGADGPAAEGVGALGSTVPRSVQEVVRRRVAGLSDRARAALEVASVAGSVVPAVALEHDHDPARAAGIDELVTRGWLREVGPTEYSFGHAIVRDAVYEELPTVRRTALHLELARTLRDAGTPSARDVDWTAVAHHDVLADDPGRVAATLDSTRRAAEQALAQTGYEDAADHYRRAADLVARHGLGEEHDAAIQLGLGAALRRAGDFAGARLALDAALDAARRLGQDDLFAEAALELVAKGGRGVGVDVPDLERAALLQEAADRLGDRQPALLVSVLAELALALMLWPDQAERRRAVAEQARRTAQDSGQAELVVRAVVADRLLQTRPSHATARLAATDAFVRRRRADVSAEARVRLHMWRLFDSWELGDRAGIDREQEALSATAEALGQRYWQWIADMWHALHTFVAGDADGADAEAAAAMARVAELEHPETILGYGIQLVGFRLHQGRGAEVVPLLRDSVASWPELAAMRGGYAVALAQAGDVDEARRQLHRLAADDFAAVADDSNWSITMTCLAEAAAVLGDRDVAAAIIPRLEPYRDHVVVVSGWGAGGACWGPFSGPLASLRACCDDRPGAVAEYDHALAATERLGAPSIHARLAEGRARLLGSTAPAPVPITGSPRPDRPG